MIPARDAASLALFAAERDSGRRIGVAVSGGSDSTALLTLFAETFGPECLWAVTVDHGLRAAARAEAVAVGVPCAAAGIPHDILTWTGWDGAGNLQARARDARYGLIAGWAGAHGIRVVALGHTCDDVAETLLMGLARSAGLDGLSGIRPAFARGGVTFHRPLLAVSRRDLRAFLAARGIEWIDDPSNADPRFDRVRVRRALELLAPAGITAERLAASARNLAADRQAIREQLADWARRHARLEAGDLVLDRAAFDPLPESYRRRLVGAGLAFVSGAAYPPRAASIAGLLERGLGTLSGCLVGRSSHAWRITREPSAAARAGDAPLAAVWDGRWRVDGPAVPEVRVAALGRVGFTRLPAAHRGDLPGVTMAAGPALWRGDRLVAAPLAGAGAYRARLIDGRDDFAAALLSY